MSLTISQRTVDDIGRRLVEISDLLTGAELSGSGCAQHFLIRGEVAAIAHLLKLEGIIARAPSSGHIPVAR